MNDWLGPSAFAPKPSEEEYSKAPIFDGPEGSAGPVAKIFKVFGMLVLAGTGLVVWVMGSVIHDTLKYGPNGKQKRR